VSLRRDIADTGTIEKPRRHGESGLRIQGNRAIVFSESDAVDNTTLSVCITAALTYHLN
jgi:hypothetical protein